MTSTISLWFRFLCQLSCFYTITHVSAYTKLATAPVRVMGDLSGNDDDDLSYASCTSSDYPTLISCGLKCGDYHIDGSYVNAGEECVAQNGKWPNSVRAVALCATSDYTCTYHKGAISGSGDDDMSTVGCSSNKIMISCSPQSSWRTIDGAYVGTRYESTTITSSTLCTARNSGGTSSNGVYAHGICCEYNRNDGYEFDCKTNWGNEAKGGSVSTASCDSGYSIFACMGYSLYSDSLTEYYQDGSCTAISVWGLLSHNVQAVATCCRLYKEPTSSPTEEPTAAPTNAPTSNPTAAPTTAPTSNPTPDPTFNPTEAPTDSTSVPTQPPSAISASPTNYPTNIPSSKSPSKQYEAAVDTRSATSQEPDENDTKEEPQSSGKMPLALIVGGILALCTIIICILCGAVLIYRRRVNKNKAIARKLSVAVEIDNEVIQQKTNDVGSFVDPDEIQSGITHIELDGEIEETHNTQVGKNEVASFSESTAAFEVGTIHAINDMLMNDVIEDMDKNDNNITSGGPEADEESEGDIVANHDDNEIVQGSDLETKKQKTDDGFQDRIVYGDGYDVDYIDEQ